MSFYTKNEFKIVCCDCCQSAYVNVFNRDQKSFYICTMCRENEPERFHNIENTRDVDRAIEYANG